MHADQHRQIGPLPARAQGHPGRAIRGGPRRPACGHRGRAIRGGPRRPACGHRGRAIRGGPGGPACGHRGRAIRGGPGGPACGHRGRAIRGGPRRPACGHPGRTTLGRPMRPRRSSRGRAAQSPASGGCGTCGHGGGQPAAGPTDITRPMPAAVSRLAMHDPTGPVPCTLMAAACLRTRTRAPPSPSPCASDAVANSEASRTRTSSGRVAMVLAGKSHSVPAAVSRAMTRSAASAWIPCSAAAAITCPRSRLPSSRPITATAARIPVRATARRESMPICSVSRSRQTHRRPGFSAGLMRDRVSRPADILALSPRAGSRPDHADDSTNGSVAPFPGSNGGPPPGGLLAGDVRTTAARGQYTAVDNAVDHLGRARRVTVDAWGKCL